MMKKLLIAMLAATTAVSGVASTGAAAAQPRGYHQDRDRDRDRHGRTDWREWRRHAERYDRRHDRRHDRRYWGGPYGYYGYQGRWRSGQRYPYWRDNRYVIYDYGAYNLPPPPPGYRYYRDDRGDVVMAAIASGIIGMIIGGALAEHEHDRDHYRR